MIKITVCGAAGRMGQRIINSIIEAEGVLLSGALERPGHPLVGQDVGLIAGCGEQGVAVSDDLNGVIAACDVMIDFTAPKVSLKNLEACGLQKKAIVIGSTGFTPDERALAAELARAIPVVLAPNMSVGVNVCFKILRDIAATLGDDFDVEIVEAHHRLKKDAPSGTAVRMGEVVAEALGRDYNKVANFHLGMGERIELSHRAMTRDMFSRGSVRAAKWVVSQKPGLYDMQDVLGLR
ncbi:MAG: 4-hydroxy-tetrahydrodipicolinate reductase [Oryzomonas sp.]